MKIIWRIIIAKQENKKTNIQNSKTSTECICMHTCIFVNRVRRKVYSVCYVEK